MTAELEKIKRILSDGGFTLAVSDGRKIYTSTERGVKPLLLILESGTVCKGFSAADKVIGKAAAYLYVLLGAGELYADVISVHALDVLKRHGISVEYGTLTEAIRNRADTGYCPMETAVMAIDEPYAALDAIRAKLAELNK